MAYQFDRKESLSEAVKRVIHEEGQAALHCLTATHGSRKEHFHEARTSLKKIRATLRLVRGEIGEKRYAHENKTFRDIAQLLSEVRDAQVLEETFECLLTHFSEQLGEFAFGTVREGIQVYTQNVAEHVFAGKEALKANCERLQMALESASQLPVERDSWKGIKKGLKRVYGQAAQSALDCETSHSDEVFHEWRKNVKYLRYQSKLLRKIWKTPLEVLGEELHQLSDALGEDHDLAMMREIVSRDPARFGQPDTIDALFSILTKRQRQLRVQARSLGARLFAESPRNFVKRIGVYWKAWRLEGECEKSNPSLTITSRRASKPTMQISRA